MRRATLVTDEMRELVAFNGRVREIEALCQRPRSKTATRTIIKALMIQLLQTPSERTVMYFLDIQERWGHLVDACKFLQGRWERWATFQDRLELIAYRFWEEPGIEELLSLVGEADKWRSILGLRCQISSLLTVIMEKCEGNFHLRQDLVSLLCWRFHGIVNVWRIFVDVQEKRQKTLTPNMNNRTQA